MRARLALRFVLVMTLTGAACFSLITMFEIMIHAQLSFGIAVTVVLPLLVAARSCGAAFVAQTGQTASLRQIANYGCWCAGLGLMMLAGILMVLNAAGDAEWTHTLDVLAKRPGTSLTLLALAYSTTALITCAGFALGARAQSRLLPNR